MKPIPRLAPAIATLGLLFAGLPARAEDKPKPVAASFPSGIDHSAWDGLLKKYVDEKGLVDYGKWKANKEDVAALKAHLATYAPKPDKPAEGDELGAAAANAYNGFAIYWIIDHYPAESIQEIDKSFSTKAWKIGGQTVSLNDIEHGTAVPALGWKAHAILVCCARSCPPMQRFAYTADELQTQIATAYETWLAREDLNKFMPEEKKVEVSSVFKWFKEDFDKGGGVKKVLAMYAPEKYRAFLAGGDYEVGYLTYNWGLNDQGGQGADYTRADFLLNEVQNFFK